MSEAPLIFRRGTGSALMVPFLWDHGTLVTVDRTEPSRPSLGHVSAALRREDEAAAVEPGGVLAGSGGDLRRR